MMTPTGSHRRRHLPSAGPGALCLLGALALLWSALPAAAAGPAAPEKTVIVDGSVYHDAGQAWLNITNFNLIGSAPGSSLPGDEAPSLSWPGGDGPDHLWAADLWVGAIKLGEQLVSSGREIRATADPIDIIYTMERGEPAGTRFPFGDPDDDGDGLIDEDPKNGRDDDGDGLVDEDYAVIGDEHFLAVMYDNTLEAREALPDHSPLDLRIVQESFQWSDPRVDDFVGFRLTVENVGAALLSQVYLGLHADFDVPAQADDAEDDLAGYWEGERAAPDGKSYLVQVAWTRDSDGSAGTGVAGLVLLDQPTASFQVLQGNLPYQLGGDPTNDSERYQLLSAGALDSDVTVPADVRVLLAAGPFPELAPGEELTLQFALVVGADLDEMLDHAAAAVMTYEGRQFPPGGGRWGPHGRHEGRRGEWIDVSWLTPWEVPGPGRPHQAARGMGRIGLSASPNPFNPQLELRYRLSEAGPVDLRIFDLAGRLVRRLIAESAPAGEGRAVWDGTDARGAQAPSGVYLARLQAGGEAASQRVLLLR